MVDADVTIAVIGVLATCVGGLIWVIKFMFTRLLPVIERLSNATDGNTRATKSADKYLKERNGRDATMHKELIVAVSKIPAQIIETAHVTAKELAKSPLSQTVKEQKVEHQVVKESRT